MSGRNNNRKRNRDTGPQPIQAPTPPPLRSVESLDDLWRLSQQAARTAEVESGQAKQAEEEATGRRETIAKLTAQIEDLQHQVREETHRADEAAARAQRHREAEERATVRAADHADSVQYHCDQLNIAHPAQRPPLPVERAAANATGITPTPTSAATPPSDVRSGPEIADTAAGATLDRFIAEHNAQAAREGATVQGGSGES